MSPSNSPVPAPPTPALNPVWTGDPGTATLPSCEIPGALFPTVGPGLGRRCLDDLETVTEQVWSCVCRTSRRLRSVILPPAAPFPPTPHPPPWAPRLRLTSSRSCFLKANKAWAGLCSHLRGLSAQALSGDISQATCASPLVVARGPLYRAAPRQHPSLPIELMDAHGCWGTYPWTPGWLVPLHLRGSKSHGVASGLPHFLCTLRGGIW